MQIHLKQVRIDERGITRARAIISYCNDRQDNSLTGNTRPYFTQGLAFFEIAAIDSGDFSAVTLLGLAGPRNERKEPDSARNGQRCQTLFVKAIVRRLCQ
jgi:hypothetical protein